MRARRGEAPRAVRRSAYVRDLLHYLADLDDLRPERHVALPVTTAVRLGVPGDSGTPSTPGTPLLPSVASFAAADATPSTTVSPLTPRDASPDTALGVLEADRVKEDASKRQRLINEIVETERTYVANLLELMDIYVKRARQPLDGHPEERVLPVAKERAVFGHIEGIVHFHAHAFLPALEHAAAPALGAPADAPCTAATAAAASCAAPGLLGALGEALGLGQEALNRQQTVVRDEHGVVGLERGRDDARLRLDGKVDLVDGPEDLVDLADLRLVFEAGSAGVRRTRWAR